jgi:hypothetical protein
MQDRTRGENHTSSAAAEIADKCVERRSETLNDSRSSSH